MRRFTRGPALLGLLAVLVLGAGGLVLWMLPGILASPGPPIAPMRPLSAVIYEDSNGAIQAWDAASGSSRVLLPPARGRALLDASDDGTLLAYLEPTPPVTPTDQFATTPYRVRIWSDGVPPQTVPIPSGVSQNLTATFFAGGDLAVLLHAASSRPGPLYAYDPGGGLLQPVTALIDSFALGPGVIAYAGAASAGQDRAVLPVHRVSILDLTGSDPATVVSTFTVAVGVPRPVQLYYEPLHSAFLYSIARPSGPAGRNVDLGLGMVSLGAAAGSAAVPLQATDATTGLTVSPGARYLLYGIAPPGAGPGGVFTRPRLAALTWLSDSLQIAQDRAVTLPANLEVTAAQFMRGRDWLVLTASRMEARVQSGITFRVPTAAVLALYDPATEALDPVVEGPAAALLAVLDERRLLLTVAGAAGPHGLLTQVVLAQRTLGGWQTRMLGTPFAADPAPSFAGMLPDGAALVAAVDPQSGAPALYRVPLDGGPARVVAPLNALGGYFPVASP